jgi:hypothetical protein
MFELAFQKELKDVNEDGPVSAHPTRIQSPPSCMTNT